MSKAYDAAFREAEHQNVERMIEQAEKECAISKQVGGDHYKKMKIQPIEFAVANRLDFFQLNVIKYVTRDKGNRMQDLEKAKHYLELYIEAVKNGY